MCAKQGGRDDICKKLRFILKTYKVYYYQLMISCGDMTGHSGGNLA